LADLPVQEAREGVGLAADPAGLRHFAASLMKAADCDLQEIQQALGYHTIITTADIYVTLFKELIHNAADKTADLLLSQARFRLHLDGSAQV
jgi:site-specific recombinase XerC